LTVEWVAVARAGFLARTAVRISGWHKKLILAVFEAEDSLRQGGATSEDIDVLVTRLHATQPGEVFVTGAGRARAAE
jgi:hypothetical protein